MKRIARLSAATLAATLASTGAYAQASRTVVSAPAATTGSSSLPAAGIAYERFIILDFDANGACPRARGDRMTSPVGFDGCALLHQGSS